MSERFNGSRPLSATLDDGPKAALREADPGWGRATDALGWRGGPAHRGQRRDTPAGPRSEHGHRLQLGVVTSDRLSQHPTGR
jgi:hypothetical protein